MFNAAGLTAISGSTIGDNHAYGNGGGIDVELDGDMSIVGSTVSGNTADDGGGIRNNGNVVVNNSTLSDNEVPLAAVESSAIQRSTGGRRPSSTARSAAIRR